jgi:glycerophosphoryl diester phosphodiesterase
MATHPENSIRGFLHAMACGADGVELDVAVSLDDVLVVTHDLVLKTGGRIVREYRAAELPLPALDDVLDLESPEKFWFDIEAKSAPDLTPSPEHYARLISEAIRRSTVAHRILVRSFDHAILRAFHAIEPNIKLAALIGYDSEEWPEIACEAQASIISPHYSTVTAARVRNAHDAGIRVNAWTVNQPKDWDRLAALEIDTIITDDPAEAVNHFSP